MSNDDIFNAADEDQVRKAEKKEKNAREQELEDLKSILDTAPGMRFMQRLMDRGHIFSTTFTGNSRSYFLEGERNFALGVFNDVCEAAPDKVAELMIRRSTENE